MRHLALIAVFGCLALAAGLAYAGDPPTVSTFQATSLTETTAELDGAFAQDLQDPVIAWFEYGTSPSLQFSTGHTVFYLPDSFGTSFNFVLTELEKNTTYYYRAAAKNSIGVGYGAVVSFTTNGIVQPPPPPPPVQPPTFDVETFSVSLLGETSARFTGVFSHNLSGPVSVWFEYGTTPNLGFSVGHQTFNDPPFPRMFFSADVFNLAPGTKYFFRAAAKGTLGTRFGEMLSFTTKSIPPPPPPPGESAPFVITDSASGIDRNSAILNGRVNPNRASTFVWFEWGSSPALGLSTTKIAIDIFPAEKDLSFFLTPFSMRISGLSANTTYYFRGVAENSFGASRGSILSFTTQSDFPGGSFPEVFTVTASSISINSANLNGSVNPRESFTGAWFEWGSTPSLGFSTGEQSMGGGSSQLSFSRFITDLSQNTTYYFRAVARNAFGTVRGSILSFTTSSDFPGGSLPTVLTFSAFSVGDTSVVLQGNVNPNFSPTTAWFEWGESSSFGFVSGSRFIGSGGSSSNFDYQITGLRPDTIYFFRAVAINSRGTSYGSTLSFRTTGFGPFGNQPTAITRFPTSISTSEATLNGSVNPNGSFTTAWFDWGETRSLGNSTGARSLGSYSFTDSFSHTLTGLRSNTLHYYRVVARNSYGTSYGAVLEFMTLWQSSPPTGALPIATTLAPLEIRTDGATLKGLAYSNTLPLEAWFEWGATPDSLIARTPSQSILSLNQLSDVTYTLTNFPPATPFYYRLAAKNSFGISYGTVLSFTTRSLPAPPPTGEPPAPRPAPPAPAEDLPLSLNYSLEPPKPEVGGKLVAKFIYENPNNGGKVLKDIKALVTIPEEAVYRSANSNFLFQAGNQFSFNLGNLEARSRAELQIQLEIKSDVKAGTVLPFSARFDYLDSVSKTRSVSISFTAEVLAAASTGFLAQLSDLGLGEWLFILILIAIAVALSAYFSRRGIRRETIIQRME